MGTHQNPTFPLQIFSTALTAILLLRFFYVFFRTGRSHPSRPPNQPLKTLIVLGSGNCWVCLGLRFGFGIVFFYIWGYLFLCLGGHTAEMINLLKVMDEDKFRPRVYVAAATDNMSLPKARVFEESLRSQEKVGSPKDQTAKYMQIYRSREVGQSYFTSIMTTLIAMVHALWITFKIRPQVVICNGPGTCIPLCLSSYIFKMLGIRWSSIFYVESIARVKRLSLSGLLLYKLHLSDQLFVQWPQLHEKYPRATYVGRLM